MNEKVKPRKRDRNYLAKVEAELFALYRHGKALSADTAEPTATDMYEVKKGALRALKALGWEPNSSSQEQRG